MSNIYLIYLNNWYSPARVGRRRASERGRTEDEIGSAVLRGHAGEDGGVVAAGGTDRRGVGRGGGPHEQRRQGAPCHPRAGRPREAAWHGAPREWRRQARLRLRTDYGGGGPFP